MTNEQTTDPLDEAIKDIKTVDDCWEQVPNKAGGFYNMETLAYPGLLKEKFSDWAEGLKQAILGKAEKEKVEYDGRQYWWSQFSGKKQYNRSIPGSGGKPGTGKPQGVTVDIPINVVVVGVEAVTQSLVSPTDKGTYKRIIFTDRNQETKKHEFVVETYKKVKAFPPYEGSDKKEDGKKEEGKAEQVEGADAALTEIKAECGCEFEVGLRVEDSEVEEWVDHPKICPAHKAALHTEIQEYIKHEAELAMKK